MLYVIQSTIPLRPVYLTRYFKVGISVQSQHVVTSETYANGLFQKKNQKGGERVEGMKFPGLLNKEHMEILLMASARTHRLCWKQVYQT